MQLTLQTQNTAHTKRQLVKETHEVLKYDPTETSLISNLDSYIEKLLIWSSRKDFRDTSENGLVFLMPSYCVFFQHLYIWLFSAIFHSVCVPAAWVGANLRMWLVAVFAST